MFEEPFANGTSILYRIDPRIRLISTITGSVCITSLQTITVSFCMLAVAGILLLSAKLPPRPLLKRICVLNLFIVFIWCTVPWTVPGTPVYTLPLAGLAISREGIELCLLVSLKTNAIAFLFLACAATMHSSTFGHAMEHLGVPKKLIFLFLFTYRYIHILAMEWERMATSAKVRGFCPTTSLHTYKTYGNMLGMLLVKSSERAQRVYEAMLLRGFSGHFTSVTEFHITPQDILFAGVFIPVCIFFVFLDRGFIFCV